jgi:Uma2 family endonuclease
MNLLAPQPTYTADDLLTLPDGDRFELVDGRLTERQMGAESAYLGYRLSRLLGNYCESPFSGWVLPSDASYQFLPDRPNLVRKPDVSFIRLGRLPNEEMPTGHVRMAPDLAVEVVSPNDLYYEVDQKVREYRQAGVRLVWLIVPPSRSVLIRRLDGTIAEVHEGDELSGEDVVPGFRCRVADIFHPSGLPPPPGGPPTLP